MMLPWRKKEVRQSDYSDAVITSILRTNSGSAALTEATETAALETAAGLYSMAFASARVTPELPALGPATRALIARLLIRRGESVHRIRVAAGVIALDPVGTYDITGESTPESWRYRCEFYGPSGSKTHNLLDSEVVHCRYAVTPDKPWLGIPPMGFSRSAASLAANTEQRLAEESGGAVAHLLPAPLDGGGDTDPYEGLKTDIAAGKGRTLLVETMAAGHGVGASGAPHRDWQTSRLGANPPDSFRMLRNDAFAAVLAACNVPIALASDADGTSQRESFRRFLTTAVIPLGEIVLEELRAKLDMPSLSFDFAGLYASDLVGRASALNKLVLAGLSVEQATAIAGLND